MKKMKTPELIRIETGKYYTDDWGNIWEIVKMVDDDDLIGDNKSLAEGVKVGQAGVSAFRPSLVDIGHRRFFSVTLADDKARGYGLREEVDIAKHPEWFI